jgi:hypothetical protein
MTPPGRSAGSYVIELGLVLLGVVAIYMFLTNGRPAAVATWLADAIGAP